MSERQQILSLLMEIEREMRALDLWSQQMPAPEALMSQQPFCVDTLNFHEWVQWLLLPRLEHMVLERIPLPETCAVAPMAEEIYRQMDADTDRLLELIEQLDKAVTEAS